jgi:maltose O-acetyltransferase
MSRLQQVNWHVRFALIDGFLRLLPPFVGSRLRVVGLRRLGIEIGHGTTIWGHPTILLNPNRPAKIRIGAEVDANRGIVFEGEHDITIGDRVSIGHEVLFLTAAQACRMGNEHASFPGGAIVVEDGVWLGARSVLMPGVRLGQGSLVGAGSIVHHDLPPNSLFVGSQIRRSLEA